MNDKMIVCNWYTPAEKMPEEGYCVAVTYSGHANHITYDHALGVGQWMDDGLGWDIEGLMSRCSRGAIWSLTKEDSDG